MSAEATPAPAKKKNKLVLTASLVLGVAVVQGGGIFLAIKLLGGTPKTNTAAEATPPAAHEAAPAPAPPAAPESGPAEVVLVERFRVPNNKSGRNFMYDFDVTLIVPAAKKEKMTEILRDRSGEIRDRLSQWIRQAHPRVLEEDDLATLRTLLQQGLSEILGDEEMIQRVLIPRWVPLRVD